MELNIDEPTSSNRQARNESMHRCIGALVHSSQCSNTACETRSCWKMKRVVLHTIICRRKTQGDCPICKQIIAICCCHAKYCHKTKCSVAYCDSIKKKIKKNPEATTKEGWLQSLSVGIRDYYASKLAITLSPGFLQQYDGAVAYDAKNIEKEVFKKSRTTKEYYRLIAEKIDNKEKALEVKKHQQPTPQRSHSSHFAIDEKLQMGASTSQMPRNFTIANPSPASVTEE